MSSANENTVRAAGTLFRTPDGRALFVRRSGLADHGGEWALPGGRIEDGEDAATAARREAVEELGAYPKDGEPYELHQHVHDGVDFTTMGHNVDEPFTPTLEDEHDAHAWVSPDSPPNPLHPGVEKMFADLQRRFAWSDDDVEIIHEGTEPAPAPEIDESEVVPTIELEISE